MKRTRFGLMLESSDFIPPQPNLAAWHHGPVYLSVRTKGQGYEPPSAAAESQAGTYNRAVLDVVASGSPLVRG